MLPPKNAALKTGNITQECKLHVHREGALIRSIEKGVHMVKKNERGDGDKDLQQGSVSVTWRGSWSVCTAGGGDLVQKCGVCTTTGGLAPCTTTRELAPGALLKTG